jgi:hypothetical protein
MQTESSSLPSLSVARAAQVIAPYLTDVFFANCEQGAFVSTCEVFAKRESVALFISSATKQYGIGIISAIDEQRIVDCYQYPSFEVAILMFLHWRGGVERE